MAKIKRRLRRTTGEMTVRQLNQDNAYIGADSAFERPAGCWSTKQHNSYIESVFSGANAVPIILTCNSTSRDLSQDLADSASDAYFSAELRKGVKWTSIDGKHRRNSIVDFVSGKRSFTGVAIDTEGNAFRAENCQFHKLPKKFQESFWESTVVRQTYTVLRHEMPTLFQGVNSGAPFTPQQYRNSIQTPIAVWARGLVNSYEGLFEKFSTAADFAKMKPHETLSKMYMHLAMKENTRCSSNELDKLYFSGEGTTNLKVCYDVSAAKACEEVLQLMYQVSSASEEKLRSKEVLPLFLVCAKIQESGMFIKSEKLLRSSITKIDDNLKDKAEEERVEDRDNDPDSIVKNAYYDEWARLNWAQPRCLRQLSLWAEIVQDLDGCGLSENSQIEVAA